MTCKESYFWFRCNRCGNAVKGFITCKKRTCLVCARTRSFQFIEIYLPIILCFQWPSFLTLTLRVKPDKDVKIEVDRIIASFRKLRKRKVWDVKRGIFSIEIVKKRDWGWFVHLHALVDSKWIDQAALSDVWRNITGDSYVVDIRRVGNPKLGLREVLKYQTKIWELNEEDKEFVEKTFRHKRFINSFGIKKPENPNFKKMKCKICGGNLEIMPDEVPVRRGGNP